MNALTLPDCQEAQFSIYDTALQIQHKVCTRARIAEKVVLAQSEKSGINTPKIPKVRDFGYPEGYLSTENQLTLTDNTPRYTTESVVVASDEDEQT